MNFEIFFNAHRTKVVKFTQSDFLQETEILKVTPKLQAAFTPPQKEGRTTALTTVGRLQ